MAAADALEEILRSKNRSRTVIHVHGWTKALSSSVIARAVSLGVPVVVTLHDYFAACPNGGFFEYPAARVCERKPLSRACLGTHCDARARTHKVWRLMRHAVQSSVGGLGQVRHFVAVSDFSARLLAPYLPKSARLHRVDNPVDAASKTLTRCASNEPFLFIGRLSAEKGPHIFAEAARRAGSRAVFVGEGEMLGRLAERYPEHRFVGWLSGNALEAAYGSARAVVVPSLWYETLGLVVLEAFARGVPVVCSDGTAPAELIVQGRNGLLFGNGNVDGLVDCLLRLRDDSLVSSLGREAFDGYWRNPHTLTRHCDGLEQVYAAMLDEREASLAA